MHREGPAPWRAYAVAVAVGILLAIGIAALLVSIVTRRQEARLFYFPLVQIAPDEPDPAVWGRNFPSQYEAIQKTLRSSQLAPYSPYGRYGGSEAFSRLEQSPDLKTVFAGNAFAVEYNEDRGHWWSVEDVKRTKRLGDKKPGTCMTCKSAQVPGIMKTLGVGQFYQTSMKDLVQRFDIKHPIACADCHDAATMSLRISRPAFREAMQRRGIDVDRASRQEMRAYVCAQCHVEYYWPGKGDYTLTFPWARGLEIEQIEAYYDGLAFADWKHEISGAPLVKVQHPEFELWSTGVHARSGVTCADCHMPYQRVGAVKISDHWVRSPLVNITAACTTCHRQSEGELRGRVLQAQSRTFELMKRAERALVEAIRAMAQAAAAGVPEAALEEARTLHRKAHLRWDFVSAENSMGFHSPQEAVRILGDAIDYARLAQLSALRAMGQVRR